MTKSRFSKQNSVVFDQNDATFSDISSFYACVIVYTSVKGVSRNPLKFLSSVF